MVNYADAKIYRIVDNATGLQYIGSTCQSLAKRMYEHKKKYKSWIERVQLHGKGAQYMTSFEVFETGNEVRIELVEKPEVTCREELFAREGHYIRQLECVNKRVAGRTMKEYQRTPEYRTRQNELRRERRATDEEYREKENAARRNPEYRTRQNEMRRERRATDEEYREKENAAQRRRLEAKRCLAIQAAKAEVETSKINQDPLIEQKREWKQELIRCQTCGGTITKGSYAAHKKTKYCLAAAAAQDDSDL